MQSQSHMSRESKRRLILYAWGIAAVAAVIPNFSSVLFFWLFPLGLLDLVERLTGWSLRQNRTWEGLQVGLRVVLLLMVGWFSYAALTTATLLADTRKVFITLYLILCLLLLANIAGCRTMRIAHCPPLPSNQSLQATPVGAGLVVWSRGSGVPELYRC